MKLDRLVEGFERVVVSFLENEYPFSFHSNEFKVVEDKVMVRKPKGISFNFVKRRACLLFHTHNEFVKEIRSLTLYGEMIQKEDLLEFHPESFYKFKQGGFWNTLRFIMMGKRRAREYLRKCGKEIDVSSLLRELNSDSP